MTTPNTTVTKVALEPGMKIALDHNGAPLTAEQLGGKNLVLTKVGNSLMVTMPDGSQTELVDFFITDDVTLVGDFWDFSADSGLVQTAEGVVPQSIELAQAPNKGVLGEEAIAEVMSETAPAVSGDGFAGGFADFALLGLIGSGSGGGSGSGSGSGGSGGGSGGSGSGGGSGGSGSGGGSGGGAAAANVPDTTLSVGIYAGPLIDTHQLTIAVYGADNEVLQAPTAVELVDGRVTVSFRGEYTGPVLLKVGDTGDAPDYRNEVDGEPKDLSVDLRAIAQIEEPSTTMAVNISPLTELVVQEITGDSGAGVEGDSEEDLSSATPEAISTANANVVNTLRLPDSGEVALMAVKTTINADGTQANDANRVGQVLAAIAGYETTISTGATAQAISDLKDAIATDAGLLASGSTSTKALELLFQGAGYVKEQSDLADAFETIAPTVSDVALTSATAMQNDTLNAGDVVTITVTMSEAVTVTGTPQIGLTIGSDAVTADYASGSGTDTLTFTYTILAGQTDADGIAIGANTLDLNGGAILDAAGNAATQTTLEHAVVENNASYLVDTTAPTITTTSLSVEENATVVGTLEGSDTGGVTWSLADGGADNDLFNLADDGALTLVDGKNFELPGSGDGTNAYTVKVAATDAAGNVTTQDITVNVTDVNEAPTANGDIAAQTAVLSQEGWTLDLAGYFADADAGDTRSYAITTGTLPDGLTLDATTGIISGAPTSEVSSSYTVTMTDGGGLWATQSFDLVVINAPVVQSFTVADDTDTTTLGKSGEALTFVVTLSETVTSEDALTAVFTVNGQEVTATSAAVTTASNTITFTGGVVPATGDGTAISLKSLTSTGAITGDVIKQPLHVFTGMTHAGYTVDNTAPTVSDVALTSATDMQNATLNAGDVVTITVTMSEAVTVTDTPQIGLRIGSESVTADYASGSGSTELTFTYTILAGQTDADGIAIEENTLNLNGGAILDEAGNAATQTTLEHAVVADNAGYSVDTTAPTVSSVGVTSATDIQNATLNAGDVVTITVTMSEAVTVTDTPQIGLTIGSESVTADYASGSGSNTLMFKYTILAGQTDADGIAIEENTLNLNGGTILDAAGNAATLTHAVVASNADYLVDTTAPTVVITSDVAALKAGGTATIKFTFSEAPTGFDAADVTVGGGAVTDLEVDETDPKIYTATFTPTADSTDEASITVSTGYTDAAGNAWVAGAPLTIAIDTVAPTITTTSLSVEENATVVGTLEGSDTGGVTWSLADGGADNDLFNLADDGALTLTDGKNFEAPGSGDGSNAYTVKVAATDAAGNVTTKDITVNVTEVNEAPTANGDIAAQTAVLNQAGWTLDLAGYFADVDAGDTRSYALTAGTLPDGLTLDATTGIISGAPTSEVSSSYTVTMTDGAGLSATQSFDLVVINAPVVQSFTVADATGTTTLGKSGEALTVVVTLSEAVTSTGTLSAVFTVNGQEVTATSEAVTGANTITFTGGVVPDMGDGTAISLKSLAADTGDITGNLTEQPLQVFTGMTHAGYTVDNTAPTVSSVSVTSATGKQNEALNAGDVVTITVTMSEAVTVTGTPQIGLTIGGASVTADYASGSGTDALTFTYTILAGQTDADGIAIEENTLNLNSGTILDAADNAATQTTLEHAGVASNPSYSVDTTAPTVSSVGVTSATDMQNGTLNAGDVVTITVTMSEAVTVTGTPQIGLTIGSESVTAGYASGSGSNTLMFTYTILADQTDADGIAIEENTLKLNGGTILDAAGNEATKTTLEHAVVENNASYLVDTTAPTITTTILSVEENATVVGTLEGSDTGGVTWSLADGGADNGLFSLADDGALTLVEGKNFEAPGSAASSNTYTVKVAATDAAGNVTTQDITVNVTDVNEAPTANGEIAVQTAVKDQATWSLDLAGYFTDVDAEDTRSYALTTGTLPNGLTLDATTGIISGAPTTVAESSSYTVTMTDGADFSVAQSFELVVVDAPAVQSFTVADATGTTTLGKSGEALTFVVTLSEAVTSTGTLSAVFTVNGQEVTATSAAVTTASNTITFTGGVVPDTGDGTVISLKSLAADTGDITGNLTAQPLQAFTAGAITYAGYTVDNTVPTVVITSDVDALKAGETAAIKFTFSEEPAGFEAADVTVTGGTLGAITGTGLTRTATFTPAENSTAAASITVGIGYTDAAGNAGVAGVTPTIAIDTVAPTVAITSDKSELKIGETAKIKFTFSEAPAGFDAADVTVGSGAVTDLEVDGGDPKIYTATFTPAENSIEAASITVGTGYTDAAGNAGAEGTSPTIAIDTVAPTVSSVGVTSATDMQNGTLNAGDVVTITVTMSEVVTVTDKPQIGLTIGSESVTAGYASGSGSNTLMFTYTILADQTDADGIAIEENTLKLNGGTILDAAGNAATQTTLTHAAVENNASYLVDTTAPTVVITSDVDALKAGETATIKFTFSEAPTGFTDTDVSSSGGAVTDLEVDGTDPKIYTATFTPAENSTAAASITVGTGYTDAAGNAGVAGVTPTIAIDTVAPTVEISSNAAALKIGETATITFTFSEAPTGFDAADVTVTGGTLGAITGTGLTRTATFTPAENSIEAASITVGTGYTDAAGNAGAEGTSPTIAIDTVAPTVSSVGVTSATDMQNGTLNAGDVVTITVTMSEVVTVTDKPQIGLTIGSESVTAGYASGSGSNTLMFTYTILADQTDADGIAIEENTLELNGGTILDAAGNAATLTHAVVENNADYLVDTTAPTVVITSDVDALKAGETATITFTFSEAPTGFDADDVTVTGGTLGAITGTGLTRTATFTPAENSTAAASITVGIGYTDAAGNAGVAGVTPTIAIDTVAPTVAITSDVAALKAGETTTITFTFSEAPTGFDAADVTVTGGTLGAITGTGLTRTATFTPAANSIEAASITVGTGYTDAAGNAGVAGDPLTIAIDTVAPTVSSVSVTSATDMQNDTLSVGDVVTITVTMSEAVTVTDKPQIGLTIGSDAVTADYASGSGTDTLTFTYTILAGQMDADGIAIGENTLELNGGAIVDAAGNAATLTHAGVADNASYLVEATAPTVSSVGVTSATDMQNDTLSVGDVVTITVTMSEVVTVTHTDTDKPQIGLTIGSESVTADYASGSGTDTLTFTYTILADQTDADGIAIEENTLDLNGGTILDAAGNAATLTHAGVADNASYLVEATAPTVSSVSVTSATDMQNDTLSVGDVVTITVTMSEVVTVTHTDTDKPQIGLTIGSDAVTADYASGSGTDTLTFTYTILEGQTDADGIAIGANTLDLNGGTILDVAGNAATLTHAGVADNASYLVEATSPTLTSSTPADDGVGVAVNSNIVLTFSENVVAGTGNIVINNRYDASDTRTIDVTDASQVTISNNTVTINPTGDLRTASAYSVLLASGVLVDAVGNDYAGIADPTAFNFTTPAASIALSDVAAGTGGFVINGQGAGDNSGFSVSSAGDVNGDGLADLIVGAFSSDPAAGGNAGRSYVVFGKTDSTAVDLSAVAVGTGGFVINGQAASDLSGYSVSSAGDVNGDGLADLIVGAAYGDPAAGGNAGRSYVMFGKTDSAAVDLSDVAAGTGGFVINGQAADDFNGWSVSSAGDVNGDGLADLIVGAIYSDPVAAADAGRSYVVFGKTGSTTVDLSDVAAGTGGFVINGQGATDQSGYSVSSAGDVNGDGLADLIVGAPYSDPTAGGNAGRSYVVFGQAGGTAVDLSDVAAGTGGFVINGQGLGDLSGASVSSAGDVNGDGLADLIVGARSSDPAAGVDAGRSYVVFGKTNNTNAVNLSDVAAGTGGFVINGQGLDDSSGYSVSIAGDVNGDGLADLIVGARYSDPGGNSNAGRSYVVFGQTGSTAVDLSDVAAGTGGFVINGQCADDNSGYSVSSAGDVNGDGLADLIVGARNSDPAGSANAGRSYVIFGSVTGAFIETAVDQLGDSEANTLTGTTNADVLVGGAGDDTLVGGGGADVLYGGSGVDTLRVSGDTVTALEGAFGAGGNVEQLSRIDGGSGIDTLALDGANITLDLTLIANQGGGSPSGFSRIESIERIDLTGTGDNTLVVGLSDVLDMAGMNIFNNANGWVDGTYGLAAGGANGVNPEQRHQLVIDGDAGDVVTATGWTAVGDVTYDSVTYNVYNQGDHAQLLIDTAVTQTAVL